MSTPSRIAIFVHYDKDNIIDKYVTRYVRRLSEVAERIYFISNCPNLPNKELEKIQSYVTNSTVRTNTGGDFAAWKTILLQLGIDSISDNYEEIILANDSCYVVSSSLLPMFENMSTKNCDMWGITENTCPTYGSGASKRDIAPHIQSYFLVFRKKILKSPIFNNFWEQVDISFTRDQTIIYYETKLTALLRQHDFICSSYMSTQPQDFNIMQNRYGHPCYDFSLFYWQELLERSNPLLKVKAIPTTLEHSDSSPKKLRQYLEKHQKTDIFQEIHQHLDRISSNYQFYHFSFLKKALRVLYRFGIKMNNISYNSFLNR